MSHCIEGKLRAPVNGWLRSQGMLPVCEVVLAGTCDLVGVQFADRVGRSIPRVVQLCAVELKMEDVAGVLRQAASNRYHVPKSYAAMPRERIMKMTPKTIAKFKREGVGLLSVGEDVFVVVEATDTECLGKHLWRKLWRRRNEETLFPRGQANKASSPKDSTD